MNKIIDLITTQIQKCNELCFCGFRHKREGLLRDQMKCGNCHSRDTLIELLTKVNDLILFKKKEDYGFEINSDKNRIKEAIDKLSCEKPYGDECGYCFHCNQKRKLKKELGLD